MKKLILLSLLFTAAIATVSHCITDEDWEAFYDNAHNPDFYPGEDFN